MTIMGGFVAMNSLSRKSMASPPYTFPTLIDMATFPIDSSHMRVIVTTRNILDPRLAFTLKMQAISQWWVL